MRYRVLFIANDRPELHYLAAIEAEDDDQARRLLHARWPCQDDLFLVRQDGRRLVLMRRS
jgi:hypothetical protein